jgi:hypothetical protein
LGHFELAKLVLSPLIISGIQIPEKFSAGDSPSRILSLFEGLLTDVFQVDTGGTWSIPHPVVVVEVVDVMVGR